MLASVKNSTMLAALVMTVAVLSGCGSMMMNNNDGMKVGLSGAQEVPPVSTSANGSSSIMVAADKSVSGGVTTMGLSGTAAHIHMAGPGKNGPVIVPLTKSGDNAWMVPAGAKLTDEQYASYLAGNTYVNVHSVTYAGGEIRAQLKGK